MKTIRVAIAVLILMGGIFVNLNPDLVDSRYDFEQSDKTTDLLGLQIDERWLVLRVAFPDSPHSETLTSSLLTGQGSAEQYVQQLSGGTSTLQVTISEEIWSSEYDESYWGADSEGERDVGNNGMGVDRLVEESAKELLSEMDLSEWDLDGDGILDRLLILHSGSAQESGGNSDSIWSHFSTLESPIQIGQWEIKHYTISSIDSGLGTLVHEMIHQMGAYDLYDVDSELPSRTWNGLGDWDIMASGNWNGDAMTPAMPGGATLLTIEGPGVQSINPELRQNITLFPMSSTDNRTRVLSIDTAPDEYVLITYRANLGFDSELPGAGIIVEYLDRNNGNLDDNTVNKDPNNPWVMIIEADGDQALLRNRDSGSSGDAFQTGDSLGSDGHLIRDNRGRLVPWNILITNIGQSNASIEIIPDQEFTSRILTPRSPIQLIEGESAYATVTTELPCTLVINISVDLTIPEPIEIEISAGNTIIQLIRFSDTTLEMGILNGNIGCKGKNPENIRIDWQSIGHRISDQEIEHVIAWDRPTTIVVPISMIGSGSRNYDVALEGAVSRIASSDTQGELISGGDLVLTIQPDGLLTPGMYARGEIVFQDEFSVEQRIDITLIAESSFTGDGALGWISQPSNGLLAISILLAFSVIIGRDSEN
ncbi:MAG: hypothetical protein CMA71_05410 [Euryarchaeota archaeon]|mgnify:CR=1 FL=1|nr:hypothetical protein [Euryarchaeota archaeon]